MARKDPRTIDGVTAEARRRRSVKSKVLRKIIDRNRNVTQIFELDEKYYSRYNKFVDAYNEAIKGMTEEEARTSRKTIDFGDIEDTKGAGKGKGEGRITVASATRIVEDTANFRQNKNFYNKLIPELKDSHQIGHKNISILRAKISLVLAEDAKEQFLSEKERKEILALREIVEEIDKIEKITGTQDEAKVDLLEYLRKVAEKGPDIKAKWQKDVDIVRGAKGKIVIEAEYTDLNQFKGRLAAWIGEVFSGIIQEDEKIFSKLIGDIDVSKIRGSNTLEEDIEGVYADFLGEGRKKNYKSKKVRPTRSKADDILPTARKTKTKRKTTKNAAKAPFIRKKRGAAKGKASAASMPLNMMVMINSQLPGVVRKNMRPPALENRTGRFAASPRVTEIGVTAQGFPSIGYSYEKNPYQTFETGFKQGSADRDPRKLIDTSIREIAVQFAIGRFYTRRV